MNECGRCAYGIARQPAVKNWPAPLYLVRAMQYRRRVIELCDCAAGRRRRESLERALQAIDEGADYVAPGELSRIHRWIDENPLLSTATGG